jgi:hypothetical protein
MAMESTDPPVVLATVGRRASVSFEIPIVFFVVSFLAYAGLQVARQAWMLLSTDVWSALHIYFATKLLFGLAAALVPALIVGFCTLWFAKLGVTRAVVLAVAIFAMIIVAGIMFQIAADGDLGIVLVLGEVMPSGSVIALMMACFIPYFRKSQVWTTFLLLWIGGGLIPYLTGVSGTLAGDYVMIAVRSVAFAALGYWLQRAGAAQTERMAAAFD